MVVLLDESKNYENVKMKSVKDSFYIKLIRLTRIHEKFNGRVSSIIVTSPLIYTPYSKTGVYRGIHYFLIFVQKH